MTDDGSLDSGCEILINAHKKDNVAWAILSASNECGYVCAQYTEAPPTTTQALQTTQTVSMDASETAMTGVPPASTWDTTQSNHPVASGQTGKAHGTGHDTYSSETGDTSPSWHHSGQTAHDTNGAHGTGTHSSMAANKPVTEDSTLKIVLIVVIVLLVVVVIAMAAYIMRLRNRQMSGYQVLLDDTQ